jgi:dihydroorotate dehydrogenase
MTALILKQLEIDPSMRSAIATDYERFVNGLPAPVEDYVRERYQIDLGSEYGGLAVKNPFGKGSGQLSLNVAQVRRDAEDGLGFVVLKTIIAEDSHGAQSMSEWAIHETRMIVERIKGADGTSGWTVSWKGRGWYDTFEKYLEFFGEALEIGSSNEMPVIPSCKYHLPRPGEGEWKVPEYEYTTRRLLQIWQQQRPSGEAMPIEKDFSPTLAGSDLAAERPIVLEWLTRVTKLIREAVNPLSVKVGLKVFNAVFDNDFQLEMMRAINEQCEENGVPDFVIYANRLFDTNREFDGVRGIAYGGPDLSARNLWVLGQMRMLEHAGDIPVCRLPISATGNIVSGRIAAEYLLRGASSFQIHTYFQLPSSEYKMLANSKTVRALHELYFHPDEGLIAWLLHLRRVFDWPGDWNIKQMADFCVEPANHVWGAAEPALL